MDANQFFDANQDFLGKDFLDNFFKNPCDNYYSTVYKRYCELYLRYNYLMDLYSGMEKSSIWKSTGILRDILDFFKDFDIDKELEKINLITRIAWAKRKDFYIPSLAFGLSKKKFLAQKKSITNDSIKFSVLVPLYNTNPIFLKEMIASLLGQSYSNWELCLADGSDAEHKYVQTICEEIMLKDKRIKYKKLEKNLGISENTNACLKMATGDYISLFDHDDLLHPSALYETNRKILEENADLIYTDEVTFYSPDLHKIKRITRKNDFAMDLLEINNYICHFLSFKRELLGSDLFDSKCDGAQDYDIILRLAEKAKKICHIKKILYYWRASPESTAFSSDAKNYTSESGRIALEKHFKRMNENALVLLTARPNYFFVLHDDNIGSSN